MLKSLAKMFSGSRGQKYDHTLDFVHHFPSLEDSGYNATGSYLKNVIVFRCVNLIAEAASHVPFIIMVRKEGGYQRAHGHPLTQLLARPNPQQAGASFFTAIIASKLLHGNAYILAHHDRAQRITELYMLDARAVNVEAKAGHPVAYSYQGAESVQHFPVDPQTLQSRVLHLKNYNPYNNLRGLSCLEAASLSIEMHSQAVRWNNALLKNGARPSGALVMREHNQHLSTEQFERLKQQFAERYTSASNTGKPLLLEGGLDWKEMSMSPKDMDFIEAKNSAARDIALAFGVPPQLLGINGDNTYSNMHEARLALWEDTILPLLDNLTDSLTNWLGYWFGKDIIIDVDKDAISALTIKRENLWEKISNAEFMTTNEKRALVGLPPLSGGDQLKS